MRLSTTSSPEESIRRARCGAPLVTVHAQASLFRQIGWSEQQLIDIKANWNIRPENANQGPICRPPRLYIISFSVYEANLLETLHPFCISLVPFCMNYLLSMHVYFSDIPFNPLFHLFTWWLHAVQFVCTTTASIILGGTGFFFLEQYCYNCILLEIMHFRK